jgi:integrase
MSANTVLHNTIIIAQFFKRQGRGGMTRLLDLPERITTLPKEYRQEELDKFLKACESLERALFYTFLLTGFREQEVMYPSWSDINLNLRTIRVTAKPQLGFYAKRRDEREVPIPLHLVEILEKHPRRESCQFVFPSPTGNREQHMLDRCKAVAKRAGLNPELFEDVPIHLCDQDAQGWLRRKNSAALDGAQINLLPAKLTASQTVS